MHSTHNKKQKRQETKTRKSVRFGGDVSLMSCRMMMIRATTKVHGVHAFTLPQFHLPHTKLHYFFSCHGLSLCCFDWGCIIRSKHITSRSNKPPFFLPHTQQTKNHTHTQPFISPIEKQVTVTCASPTTEETYYTNTNIEKVATDQDRTSRRFKYCKTNQQHQKLTVNPLPSHPKPTKEVGTGKTRLNRIEVDEEGEE